MMPSGQTHHWILLTLIIGNMGFFSCFAQADFPINHIPQLPVDSLPPEKPPWIQRIFLKKEPPPKESDIVEVGPRTYGANPAIMLRLSQPICTGPNGQSRIAPGFYLSTAHWPADKSQPGQLTLLRGSETIGSISLVHHQGLPAEPVTQPNSPNAARSAQLIEGSDGHLRLRVDVPSDMESWFSAPCECSSSTGRY